MFAQESVLFVVVDLGVHGVSVSAGASGRSLRSARTTAAATPISTATMRSNAMVAAAVSTSTSASERVERRIERTLCTSTMRTAVTISTPASAATGSVATSARRRDDDQDERERMHDRGERGCGRRRGR